MQVQESVKPNINEKFLVGFLKRNRSAKVIIPEKPADTQLKSPTKVVVKTNDMERKCNSALLLS